MILIIALIGLTLSSFSRADIRDHPMNLIMWDGIAEFYNSKAGTDVDVFSVMSYDKRYNLCSAVGIAAQFIFTSDNYQDIISGGFASTDSEFPIQTATVSVNNRQDRRTVMLCKLQNEETFYLGKGRYPSTYFLYSLSDTNVFPTLRAAVEHAIRMTWSENIWLYPAINSQEDDSNVHRRNYQFCRLKDVDLLNICASVHRCRTDYHDHEKSYTLNLEPGTPVLDRTNYCREMVIETRTFNYGPCHVFPISINVVTCKVYSYDDRNLTITYRITPDPTDYENFFLVGPVEGRENLVDVKVKLIEW